MSLPPEVDDLVQQLSHSLEPPQRRAFIDAAQTALESIPCLGVGVAYRTLVGLQRRFFDPPSDTVEAHAPRHYRRPTKLSSLPPIGRPDRAEGGQQRNAWRRGA
jgi:hypothetical protein